jgi:ABC-type Fe3+ transport system substrate-binding protein
VGLAWPEEGVVLVAVPMAIVKGTKRPSAAKLLMDFFLSEEAMHEYVAGELRFSFREGFKNPEAVQQYMPDVDKVKALPMNWAALTDAEIKKVQEEFRKILKVD